MKKKNFWVDRRIVTTKMWFKLKDGRNTGPRKNDIWFGKAEKWDFRNFLGN